MASVPPLVQGAGRFAATNDESDDADENAQREDCSNDGASENKNNCSRCLRDTFKKILSQSKSMEQAYSQHPVEGTGMDCPRTEAQGFSVQSARMDLV